MKKLCMVVLFILLIVTLWAGGTPESGGVYTDGEIAYTEGDVTLNGKSVDFGADVQSGDTVTTGAASNCDIVFGGGNVFRVHENSIAIIDFSKAEIDLKKGALSAVLNKIAGKRKGEEEAFSVRTPHTVAGVRGTVFFLKVESDHSSYVCTCHGKVHYEDINGENKMDTEKYHHGAIRYSLDGGKIITEEGKLLYHNDDSMEATARRIDYKIPWGNPR